MSETEKMIEQTIPPPVMWAERKDKLFLTVCLEDCKNPVIKLEADKLYFKGKGGTDNKEYENTIEFFAEINPEKSKYNLRDRNIEFIIFKKEDSKYWNRLLKNTTKAHWLKVDFNKWKADDSDVSDDDFDVKGEGDIEEMMKQMGGLGGSGDRPNLDDLEGAMDEEDSDDEELPDLE